MQLNSLLLPNSKLITRLASLDGVAISAAGLHWLWSCDHFQMVCPIKIPISYKRRLSNEQHNSHPAALIKTMNLAAKETLLQVGRAPSSLI